MDKQPLAIGEQHKKIQRVKALISNTKPNPERLFVIEGLWAHEKILSARDTSYIEMRTFIYCPECVYSPEAKAMVSRFSEICGEIFTVSKKTFLKISERDEPDGLLSIGKFPVMSAEDVESLIVGREAVIIVLDGLEIPGNIGTIIRSADGAGVDAIFLCNRRARLTNPKLIKGSMGAVFTKPIAEFASAEDCKAWLNCRNFNIYLADTRADKSYFEYDYKSRTALIVGSERYGISRLWYDENAHMIDVPMLGNCDSLNVGVATTIIMYEMCLKQKNILKRKVE